MQDQIQEYSCLKSIVNGESFQMPGAWYDASARVESMAAIARAIVEMSMSNNKEQKDLDITVGLAVALEDISKLALQDIERIEKEMLS